MLLAALRHCQLPGAHLCASPYFKTESDMLPRMSPEAFPASAEFRRMHITACWVCPDHAVGTHASCQHGSDVPNI